MFPNESHHTAKEIHCKAQTKSLDYSCIIRQTLKLMVLKVFRVISFAQRHSPELISKSCILITLNVQLLELLELDCLALEWGCPHSTWGFGKDAPWELQGCRR